MPAELVPHSSGVGGSILALTSPDSAGYVSEPLRRRSQPAQQRHLGAGREFHRPGRGAATISGSLGQGGAPAGRMPAKGAAL